jgi:succinate dehydrogenase (ubiquinone) flavoprotein subunit
MQRTMQKNAGVFRIDKTLQEGCERIDEALQMFNNVGIKDRVF